MVEILPGVHQIDGVNANGYFFSEDDGSLTLIDTCMPKDGKKILDYLQTNKFKETLKCKNNRLDSQTHRPREGCIRGKESHRG